MAKQIVNSFMHPQKCWCGRKKIDIQTNIDEDQFAHGRRLLFRAVCPKCKTKTKFYVGQGQAQDAFVNKGWVNRRRENGEATEAG